MKKNVIYLAAVVFLMLGSLVTQAAACNCAHGSGKDSKMNGGNAPKVSDPLAAKLLPSYLAIRTALASDSVTDVDKNATVFIKSLKDAITKAHKDKQSGGNIAALETLAKNADHFTMKGLGIDHYREHFGKLSDLLVSWVQSNVSATDAEKYQLYYCGMQQHYWLQKTGGKIGNPYYGTAMPTCGEKRSITVASACEKGTCGQNCDKNGCGQSQGHDMHGMQGM